MTNEKNYPNAVVLKKRIMYGAIALFVMVVGVIFYNMMSYNSAAKTETKAAAIQNTANTENTTWFTNRSVQKPTLPVQALPTGDGKTLTGQGITPVNHVGTQANAQEAEAAKQKAIELEKVMSAQITSNRLLPDNLSDNASNKNTGATSVPNAGNSAMSNMPGLKDSASPDQNMQKEKKAFLQENTQNDEDYLHQNLKDPISSYEVQAGTIIPGVLMTNINSDLPGQIIGQVKSNVYDSSSGRYLLIPQGAKLVGVYDSQVAYGQERVLVAWKRIIYPNGKSFNLEGMPGADLMGSAGFNDEVNNHYAKIGFAVLLTSILSAGPQLAQPRNDNADSPYAAPTVGQTIAQSVGTNIANAGTMIVSKNINIQPTLVIRQGYEFNVSVTKDMVFPGPYVAG